MAGVGIVDSELAQELAIDIGLAPDAQTALDIEPRPISPADGPGGHSRRFIRDIVRDIIRRNKRRLGHVSGTPAHPLQQCLVEHIRVHRLGDEVDHPGFQAGAPVIVEGIGGHGQHRRRFAPGQGMDGSRRLQPVHHRHLHIHQDQRIGMDASLIHGLTAVFSGIDDQAGLQQQHLGHFAIHVDVVDQEYPLPGVPAQRGFGVTVSVLTGGGRCRHDTLTTLQARGKPEGRTLPGRAIDAGVAAHQAGQTLADRQPESGTAVLAGGGYIRLLERLEQVSLLFLRYPDAGILDFEAHQYPFRGFVEQGCPHRDEAAVGKLDRVAGEIQQCLPHPGRIAPQPERHRLRIHFHRKPFGPGLVGDHRIHIVEQYPEIEILVLQLQPSGLDLGDVEDIVDDGQQMPPRTLDLGELIRLGRGRRAPAQQMGEAKYGVHRGADFMAHVGEESALGPVRGLGQFTRRRQLFRAPAHQFLQVVPVLIEFLAQAFPFADVERIGEDAGPSVELRHFG